MKSPFWNDAEQLCRSYMQWHCHPSGRQRIHHHFTFHPLLALDGPVYVTHKHKWCPIANWTKHQKETVTDTAHIAEEKWCLHQPCHVWSYKVVVVAVTIDEEARWSTTEHRPEPRKSLIKITHINLRCWRRQWRIQVCLSKICQQWLLT
jgi:hypothetical protein